MAKSPIAIVDAFAVLRDNAETAAVLHIQVREVKGQKIELATEFTDAFSDLIVFDVRGSCLAG